MCFCPSHFGLCKGNEKRMIMLFQVTSFSDKQKLDVFDLLLALNKPIEVKSNKFGSSITVYSPITLAEELSLESFAKRNNMVIYV